MPSFGRSAGHVAVIGGTVIEVAGIKTTGEVPARRGRFGRAGHGSSRSCATTCPRVWSTYLATGVPAHYRSQQSQQHEVRLDVHMLTPCPHCAHLSAAVHRPLLQQTVGSEHPPSIRPQAQPALVQKPRQETPSQQLKKPPGDTPQPPAPEPASVEFCFDVVDASLLDPELLVTPAPPSGPPSLGSMTAMPPQAASSNASPAALMERPRHSHACPQQTGLGSCSGRSCP